MLNFDFHVVYVSLEKSCARIKGYRQVFKVFHSSGLRV